jgi:DNA-3-methyladenine glycosylase
MFGPPGRLYVYFTYGMHHCANVVTGDDGDAQAVLLRALAPLDGLDLMRARRGAHVRPVELANGPGKLCQAFGIDRTVDGAVLGRDGIVIVDDGVAPPAAPGVSTRVGIRHAVERPWRWYVTGEPHVSKGRPSG